MHTLQDAKKHIIYVAIELEAKIPGKALWTFLKKKKKKFSFVVDGSLN